MIWRNIWNRKIVNKYAKPLDLGPVPSKRQFGGTRGWSFFCAHKPSPWLIGIKWENTKIFQMDGKDEYIPKGWKRWKYSKIKTQLRESSIIPIHKYYTGSNELNLITMQRKQDPLKTPCRPPCDLGALLNTIGLKAQLCRLT